MQPACHPLRVVPGATTRTPLMLMQPVYAYRSISAVTRTAPLGIVAPAHGLASGWPVWVSGVSGWPALNRDPVRERPRVATVIDADMIEFNDLDGTDQRASGGRLVYRLPVDLAGCTATLALAGEGQALSFTTENGGLAIDGPGRLLLTITRAQSTGLPWRRGHYTLDITMSTGDVMRWLCGEVSIGNGGCGNGC